MSKPHPRALNDDKSSRTLQFGEPADRKASASAPAGRTADDERVFIPWSIAENDQGTQLPRHRKHFFWDFLVPAGAGLLALALTLFALLAMVVGAAATEADPFDVALQWFQRGQFDRAAALLEAAVQERPVDSNPGWVSRRSSAAVRVRPRARRLPSASWNRCSG